MSFKLFLISLLGKTISFLSRLLNLGAGLTWPGEVALLIDPYILKKLSSQVRGGIILVAGTNGKTTTAKLIKTTLNKLKKNKKIIHNESGANLLNGLVSALIVDSDLFGRAGVDYAIFEVDEATFPQALKQTRPKIIILLNLFRDQLDRYGEVDLLAEKWGKVLKTLDLETTLILNSDDPQIAYLGKNLKCRVLYFGLSNQSLFLPKMPHATDSIYCLSCREKLDFQGVYFSHLGLWRCLKCKQKRPLPCLSSLKRWPLEGVYNQYNALAAVLAAKELTGADFTKIEKALERFQPAFGRQEEFKKGRKKIRILLSKNPTGFNQSIRTITEKPREVVMVVLNDQIPDGRDVSWIWDVDFEELMPYCKTIICSGSRVYDLGLRLKYAKQAQNSKLKTQSKDQQRKFFDQIIIERNLKRAVTLGLEKIRVDETLYILPTYSAMLEVRKILSGRKIL